MATITTEKSKNITLNESIQVDGKTVVSINASIDNNNPENISGLAPYINDQELYRVNRAGIKAEITKFEDSVYAEQDKMIAEKSGGAK